MVGAVGTGAPWFLTGWAEGIEVEFMIVIGCQVTILANVSANVYHRPTGPAPALSPAVGIRRLVSINDMWGVLDSWAVLGLKDC